MQLILLILVSIASTTPGPQTGASITAVAPTFGPTGTTVSIRGSGFSGFEPVTRWVRELASEPPPGRVEFNGVPGEILFWQDDLISVKVPKGASTGPVRVVLANGRHSLTSVIFEVYYSNPADRQMNPAEDATGLSRSADDPNRNEAREPGLRFDEPSPPTIPLYSNPWFSSLSPGERTFWGEQGFTEAFLFGNPFTLGRKHSFLFDDGFFSHPGVNARRGFDRFGFQDLFFRDFIFRSSGNTSVRPFWFLFDRNHRTSVRNNWPIFRR